MIVLVVMAALLMDRLLGEPRHWHPLVGFGHLAEGLRQRLYAKTLPAGRQRLRGVLAVTLLIVPFALLAASTRLTPVPWLFDLVLLYLALGWRSLDDHALRVATALHHADTHQARRQVSLLVSRDTETMESVDIARASVESVLENGNDAVLGTLFWFVLAGAPGAVVHRLANTLDAMWGYRRPPYRYFGWAAARFDDLLNYVPARLTALSYAVTGNGAAALRCWRDQASTWKSPNAGPVMAAGAGSLGVRLGGRASYHGQIQDRPVLGCSRDPVATDIDRARQQLRRGVILWLAVLTAAALLLTSLSP